MIITQANVRVWEFTFLLNFSRQGQNRNQKLS